MLLASGVRAACTRQEPATTEEGAVFEVEELKNR